MTNTLSSILANSQSEEQKKLNVWNKGHIIPGRDPQMWRSDDMNYIIYFFDYGNRNSKYGWEFDHYPVPASKGGSDGLHNLRPLFWGANVRLGDQGGLGSFLR